MADTGKVNIHGKEYTTVAARVQKFREEHKDQYAIVTEIISADDDRVVMKASIIRLGSQKKIEGAVDYIMPENQVIATGHAEEVRQSSTINKTSALENAETSAIGRALAAFGMAGTEFASADEVANAIGQQGRSQASSSASKQQPKPKPSADSAITNAQGAMLLGMAKRKGQLETRDEALAYFEQEAGMPLNAVKQRDLERVKAVFGPDVEVEV